MTFMIFAMPNENIAIAEPISRPRTFPLLSEEELLCDESPKTAPKKGFRIMKLTIVRAMPVAISRE